MKLCDLIQNDIESMEKMSSVEIENFFAPMLSVLRPERRTQIDATKTKVTKATLSTKTKDRIATLSEAQKAQMALLGIDPELLK